MTLHTNDISTGLGIPFDPPVLCAARCSRTPATGRRSRSNAPTTAGSDLLVEPRASATRLNRTLVGSGTEIPVEHLVHVQQVRLLARVEAEAFEPARLHPELHPADVLVVLRGDRAPVALVPVGVEVARRAWSIPARDWATRAPMCP